MVLCRQRRSCELVFQYLAGNEVGLDEDKVPLAADNVIFSFKVIFCGLCVDCFGEAPRSERASERAAIVTSSCLAGQGSQYRQIPVLNLILVIVLGLNSPLELVLFTCSTFVIPKTW